MYDNHYFYAFVPSSGYSDYTQPSHFEQFITEHRDTFSSTKTSRDNVSVSFTHITECQIKDDNHYILMLVTASQIFMGKSELVIGSQIYMGKS